MSVRSKLGEFYNRRLGEDLPHVQRERRLYHHYDYTQAYIHDGYYVIEGVMVMPSYLCHNSRVRNLAEEERSMSNFERHASGVDASKLESGDVVAQDTDSSAQAEAPKNRDLTYCE